MVRKQATERCGWRDGNGVELTLSRYFSGTGTFLSKDIAACEDGPLADQIALQGDAAQVDAHRTGIDLVGSCPSLAGLMHDVQKASWKCGDEDDVTVGARASVLLRGIPCA